MPKIGKKSSVQSQKHDEEEECQPLQTESSMEDEQINTDSEPTLHLQILLAVSLAVFCFSIVLGCIICWRHRKSNSSDSKEAGLFLSSAPTDQVTVTLNSSPSLQILPIKQQYEELEGYVLDCAVQIDSLTESEDNLNTPNICQKSRFALRRLSTPAVPSSPYKSVTRGRASLPSIPKLSLVAKTRRAGDRRCTVAGVNFLYPENTKTTSTDLPLPSYHQRDFSPSQCSSRRGSFSNKQPPEIQFSLLFSPAQCTLTVTVLRLFRGSRRVSGATVHASLPPLCPATMQIVPECRSSLTPEPQTQVFTLKEGTVKELQTCTLKLAVISKDFSGLREAPLGELQLDCADIYWEPDAEISYSLQLNPASRRIKKSTQDYLGTLKTLASVQKPLGQILILLQYQTQAHRIKVMVRKAENLAKLTRMPGAADHYVIINLRQSGTIISTKETKGASGPNAVWNSPFLFDLPAGDMVRLPLVLEFIIMQGRLYTKSSALGRVLIGCEGPETGQQHWREMFSRGQVETARWHPVISDTP
ncbi:uncharacterized protein LOC134323454 [Trichomycterus rosablanca]|uniref:uncharacterized protein LOC134323454 n=1 Tax=Trichomycterus rosablanca TaxID=2290929 RepID=UPI002F35314E